MGNLKKTSVAVVLSLLLAGEAHSFCFDEAGALYKINPQILRAIAKVESNFNATALNKNTNGTYDVGLMQINSGWAATLGKERWNQLGEACYNTKTGAWILSQCIGKYGYNWKAIGCYHSQTPEKRDHYAKMVFDQLQKVVPVAQEAAYAPLRSRLETVVQKEVESLVAESVRKTLAQAEQPPAQSPAAEQPPEQPPEQPQAQPTEQPQAQPQEEQQVQPPVEQPQTQEQPPASNQEDLGEPAPVPEQPEGENPQ